jgi:hypothetical protein
MKSFLLRRKYVIYPSWEMLVLDVNVRFQIINHTCELPDAQPDDEDRNRGQ